MKLRSTLGLNDGSFVYIFGKDKYCKVSTGDRICELKNITELLYCPNIITDLSSTNTTDDSNVEEVSETNNNMIGYVIIRICVLIMISITIASVVILVFVKRKDKTIEEEVDTKSRASKKRH
jgi:hypothetical protein